MFKQVVEQYSEQSDSSDKQYTVNDHPLKGVACRYACKPMLTSLSHQSKD